MLNYIYVIAAYLLVRLANRFLTLLESNKTQGIILLPLFSVVTVALFLISMALLIVNEICLLIFGGERKETALDEAYLNEYNHLISR